MTLQLDPYQIITLLFTAAVALLGVFKMILASINTRFATMESSSKEEIKDISKELSRIDRELLALKADLPNQYQRRDDAIRNQTIIEAKIDGLANKLGELHIIDRRRRREDE